MWIHLPELPIEYYKPSVLRELGQAIGPVLRVDTHTTTESRGRFDRICVQINFEKPLIKLIWTGDIKQLVLYKGIKALCFSCGRVGHKVQSCPYTTKAPVNKDARKEEDKVDGHVSVASECNEPSKEVYGPWVLVSRKKYSKKKKKDPAKSPLYGMAYLLKTRLPDQAESPIFFKPDPSISEERDKPHDSKLLSKMSAPTTNHTSQLKLKISLGPLYISQPLKLYPKIHGPIREGMVFQG